MHTGLPRRIKDGGARLNADFMLVDA